MFSGRSSTFLAAIFTHIILGALIASCGSDLGTEALNGAATDDNNSASESPVINGDVSLTSHGSFYTPGVVWLLDSDQIINGYYSPGWIPNYAALGDSGRSIAVSWKGNAQKVMMPSRRSLTTATSAPAMLQTSVASSSEHGGAMSPISDLAAYKYIVPDGVTGFYYRLRVDVHAPARGIQYTLNFPENLTFGDSGQRVFVTANETLVVMIKDATNKLSVRRYVGATGTLINSFVINNTYPLVDTDISRDGKYILFTLATKVQIYSLSDGLLYYNNNPFIGDLTAGAISEDANYVAICGNGRTVVQKKTAAGVYSTPLIIEPVTETLYCNGVDFSGDNQTVMFAFKSGINNVMVRAVNLATLQESMHYTIQGTGTLQNLPVAVKGSNTDKFIVGVQGDGSVAMGGGMAKEAYIFDRNINTPLLELDMPGSVIGVDISADGKVAAVAGKGTVVNNSHINIFGNGGYFASILVDTQKDLMVRGVPWRSLPANPSTVEVEAVGAAGATMKLYESSTFNAANVSGAGQCLGADRQEVGSGVVGSDNKAMFNVTLPSTSNTTRYYQSVALINGQRQWSRSCEKVTTLAR